jgi:hypothetical protein
VSQPESNSDRPRGVLVRHPTTTVYTVILGLSAAALAVGCLIMLVEIWQYGSPLTFPWKIPINYR